MVSYRYSLVKYLPWMYVYEFLLSTSKPRQITSLGTLWYPFDGYVWAFTGGCTTVVLVLLRTIQKLWLQASESEAPQNDIFQGAFQLTDFNFPNFTPPLTDLTLCVRILLNQGSSRKLVHRLGFKARKFLLLEWFLLGGILSWAYMQTLLATLVVIKYEPTIDTIRDLDQSGLPFLIPKNTAPHKLIASDPRPAVAHIFKKSIVYSLAGTPPKWAVDM